MKWKGIDLTDGMRESGERWRERQVFEWFQGVPENSLWSQSSPKRPMHNVFSSILHD